MRPNVIYPPAEDGSEAPRRVTSALQFPIFFGCFSRAWDDVVKRAKSHPLDVFVQDEATGNTPLHEACRLDPPVEVILALQATSRTKNDLGATPLHIAASHRCSAAALLALLDCASKLKDTSPCTDFTNIERAPIHYACMSFRGLEIEAFMLLLDRTLKEGFVAVDNCREPKLGFEEIDDDEFYDSFSAQEKNGHELYVNVISMKDSQGQTPLALLFRRYRQRVRSVISTIDSLRNENKGAPEKAALISAMTVHGELGELWEKARRIVTRLTEARLEREGTALEESLCHSHSPGAVAERLGAAAWASEQHRAGDPTDTDVLPVYVDVVDREASSSPILNTSTNSRRQFRIVHASVGLIGYGCPPEMIRLAISIHPHQVREMDEDGNLPIHIAVKASSFLGTVDDNARTMAVAAAAAANASDDASLLSDAFSFFSSATVSQTTNPFDKVIKILLKHYPDAARIPQGESGQLPLILAIETGHRTWEDGIRTLLHAYPPALHNKKIIDPPLFPCVLALVANSIETDPVEARPSSRPTFRTKQVRRVNCSRNILYQLIRSKPEWLTAEGRDERQCTK